MTIPKRFFLITALTIVGGGSLAFLIAAGPRPEVQAASSAWRDEIAPLGSLTDRPLAEYQSELLELAFRSASAFPLEPHSKNRSRAQEQVVTTSLELDQPVRALGFIEEIADWRRGAAVADLAFYLARKGEQAEVQRLLDLASRISDDIGKEVEEAGAQIWQRDRIRVKIARTHALLGHTHEAARWESGVVESESGKVDSVRAMIPGPEEFEGFLRDLDAVVATGSFDPIRAALEAFVQLHDRVYEDAARRELVEQKIKASWNKLPTQIRVEMMMELARSAVSHEDRKDALRLVDETRAILDGVPWNPEDAIPMAARLAALRFHAGDKAQARQEVDAALASFDAEREGIVDIYRAGALRPVAEAYRVLGDLALALKVYARVVEEGVHNPNSRPRANDLVATCCSMALHEVEPGVELAARLRHLCIGLGNPW